MPAMYPEELRDLRARHPELQYDFRGNVIGTTPLDSVQMAANAIYQLPGMQPNAWDFGPTRNDYLNSRDFVGPMPQQWWDPNGELMQQGQDWLGGFMQGFDLQPRRASRPRNPYASQPSQPQPATDFGGQQGSALHANVEGLGTDYMRQPGDVNPLGYRPPTQPDGGAGPSYAAGTFLRSANRAARDAAFYGNPANETFPNLAYQQE